MATTSLFRKWRSQSFEDLVGQGAVVRTLRNALTSGSPARAYLFCGPRGTGKTSTARIFAKALNCRNGPTAEPCNECSLCKRIADGSCMDVLEIDAASHTQVDKIREFIVDKVHFAPAEARFKIYIIDEVHKLSTSSFNALLKTLEEPPPHVVFILATTHPHELLPTILSRCQRHDFHRLTPPEIRERLVLVSGEEGIQLAPGAADLLARSAEGSLRDALVQLEQVATFAGATVGEEDVRTLLGLAGRTAMNQLVAALASSDARAALGMLHELVQAGRDLGRLSGELVDHLRRLLLIVVKAADGDLLGIPPEEVQDLQAQAAGLSASRVMGWLKVAMELQGEARDAQRARLLWEMMLIRLTVPDVEIDVEALARRLERLEASLAAGGRPAAPSPPGPAPTVIAPRVAPPAPPRPPFEPAGSTARQRSEAQTAPGKPLPPAPEKPSAPAAPPPASRKPAPPAPAPGPSPEPPRPAAPPLRRTAEALGWGTPAPEGPSRPKVGDSRPAAHGAAEQVPPAPVPDRVPVEPSHAAPAPAPSLPEVARQSPGSVPHGAPKSGDAPPPSQVGDAPAREFWQRLLTVVRERDRRLHAVLVEARIQRLQELEVVITFPTQYRWHFEKFQEGRAAFEALASEVLGRPVRALASLGGEAGAAPHGQEEHRSFVKRAEGMFNGRVVGEPGP